MNTKNVPAGAVCGRRKSWAVALALLAVMGVLGLGGFSQGARAVTVHSGWNGWDGNAVFYMTAGIPNTKQRVPPPDDLQHIL